MIWTHCEVYWDLDFEPFENEWRAASGMGGFGVWLGGYFSAWVLIDTIIHPCFNHAVSHVASVYALKPEHQNAIDHVCAFGAFDHSSFCRWFWL